MTRTTRMLALGAALVAGVPLSPIVPGRPAGPVARAAVASRGDVITVNVRGTGQREPSAPNRFVRTVDLYSMSGEKVGTATRDFAFTGPYTGDEVMTFRFPDGQLVNHAVLSFALDLTHPGFFHVGVQDQDHTIVPERGTGAYAGRTGKLRMAGWHDGRTFPEQATFDDFYWIELDPKA